MSVIKCLKCDEPVSVPTGASLKAVVRCPLCQEEFELGEMLDEIPPPLEIVEDPEAVAAEEARPFNFDLEGKEEAESVGADSEETAGEHEEAGAAVAVETDDHASDEVDHGGVAAFQFDDSSQEAGAGGAATKSAHPAARPRPKGKHPVAEIAKIIAGGALGIVLAVVGIWWIAKKDPFKLGPKVSGVAPWIVPEKFHGPDNKEDDKEAEDEDGQRKNRRPRGVDLPQANSERNEHIGQQNFQPKFNPDGTARANSSNTPNRDKPNSRPDPPDEANDEPPLVDRSTSDFLGIRNVETATTDEVKEALNGAEVAVTIWDADLESDDYRQRALQALADLGKSLACANQTLEDNQDLITKAEKDVLEFLAANATKLGVVTDWAAEQVKSGRPDLQGVVLAAEVMSIEAMGPLFVNRLELLTENREELSMLTARDISSVAAPGAKIVAVGALVGDPAVNFGGYRGNDDKVLGCGTLIVLQSASNP